QRPDPIAIREWRASFRESGARADGDHAGAGPGRPADDAEAAELGPVGLPQVLGLRGRPGVGDQEAVGAARVAEHHHPVLQVVVVGDDERALVDVVGGRIYVIRLSVTCETLCVYGMR